MKILAIGDIVGRIGRDSVMYYLEKHKEEYDLIIANGENAAHGNGMSRSVYQELCGYGIDGFTMGNHTWGCPDVITLMKYNQNIIRPANFDKNCPGKGSMVLEAKNGVSVGIINLIGRVYMPLPFDSPFTAAKRELGFLKSRSDIILVDFHAEATSEKMTMGYFLDGEVSAIFGTHTHIQTADETILPSGTGYITDLGMTGAVHSILGMDKKVIMNRFLNGMPSKFELATGDGQFCACEFEIDEITGKTKNIKRIFHKEKKDCR